jgi:photosystem II stability/assembly factor-like uncharacterized protein
MEVWELVVHPREPNIVYTGTDDGVYRSEDRGNSWEKLDSPMDSLHTWTLAIDPVEPDTIFAGTRPSAVFRSQDGGQRWEKLSMELAEECRDVVIPRVSVLKVDPENHRNIWAGIEVDGVRRSLDGGDTWTTIGSGLDDPDIHDIALSGGQPNTIFATTPKEIFASANGGESWLALEVMKQFSHAYIRPIRLKEDNPQVIFVGHGNNRPPTTGSIERSTDGGNTWESLPLPVEPNSYILCIATHPSDPNLVIATSRFGELYRSFDGGDSWQKLRQEFSEVRGLAWTPN